MQQRLGGKANHWRQLFAEFRNRQDQLRKEFDYSIKLAKRKRNPRKYLCLFTECDPAKTVIGCANWLPGAKAKAAEERHKQMQEQCSPSIGTMD